MVRTDFVSIFYFLSFVRLFWDYGGLFILRLWGASCMVIQSVWLC